MLTLLNGGFQAGKGLFPFVTRLLQLRLLSFLLVDQRLLLALLLFEHRLLHRHLFARFLQFRDGFLTGLVEIAEVDLHPLIALALFTAQHHLDAGMRPLAERGVKLRGEVTLLRRALALQLRERGVHFVNLLIELVQVVLGFAQFAGRGGDRFFLRFELGEQACALLLLLLNRPLPGGDVGLDGL